MKEYFQSEGRHLKLNIPLPYTEMLAEAFALIDKFSPQVILNNNQRQILKYKQKNNFLFKNLPKSKIVNGKFGKKLADLELGLKYLKSPHEIKNILWPNNVFLNICSYIFKILLWLKWRNKLIR